MKYWNMKGIIPFLLILFFLSLVYAKTYSQDYNNPLTISMANSIFCRQDSDCYLNNLIVQNLSIIGDVLNITVIDYNVTGQITGSNIWLNGWLNASEINARNEITLGGRLISSWDEVNSSIVDTSMYIINESDINALTINASIINSTIIYENSTKLEDKYILKGQESTWSIQYIDGYWYMPFG